VPGVRPVFVLPSGALSRSIPVAAPWPELTWSGYSAPSNAAGAPTGSLNFRRLRGRDPTPLPQGHGRRRGRSRGSEGDPTLRTVMTSGFRDARILPCARGSSRSADTRGDRKAVAGQGPRWFRDVANTTRVGSLAGEWTHLAISSQSSSPPASALNGPTVPALVAARRYACPSLELSMSGPRTRPPARRTPTTD
jgi:hypothetical protein